MVRALVSGFGCGRPSTSTMMTMIAYRSLALRLTHKSPPPHITIPSAVDGQEQQDAQLHQLPDAGDHPGQVSLTALIGCCVCYVCVGDDDAGWKPTCTLACLCLVRPPQDKRPGISGWSTDRLVTESVSTKRCGRGSDSPINVTHETPSAFHHTSHPTTPQPHAGGDVHGLRPAHEPGAGRLRGVP